MLPHAGGREKHRLALPRGIGPLFRLEGAEQRRVRLPTFVSNQGSSQNTASIQLFCTVKLSVGKFVVRSVVQTKRSGGICKEMLI